MKMNYLCFTLVCLSIFFLATSCGLDAQANNKEVKTASHSTIDTIEPRLHFEIETKVQHDDAYWKAHLPAATYRVMRQQGTERAFTGSLLKENRKGIFYCAACGLALFDSDTKFKSGTGWPSFYAPYKEAFVPSQMDASHGMQRSEVHCGACKGHLGHVFDDGPPPTGLRYCINSVALKFEPQE